jgi:hypothetical protein
MNRILQHTGFEDTAAVTTTEVRQEELRAMYRDVEEEYLQVIERLAVASD